MLKSLAILLITLTVFFRLNATIIKDTNSDFRPRSYAWFHLKYGKDDTSKAIIDFFFLKRRKTLVPLLVTSGISLATGIAALLSEGSSIQREPDSQVGLSLSTLVSGSIGIFFLFEYIKYSRRELIKTLQRYQAGEGVSKWLQRLPSWRNFLAGYIQKR